MDRDLFEDVDRECPELNPVLARGLAVRELSKVEEELNRHWLQIANQYPSVLGIKYIGGVRCSPEESRRQALRSRRSMQTYELSNSTVYLMQYHLEMNGIPLEPIYLYLPYVQQAGLITINGSRFSISPVLADIAMSIGPDNIFIYMGKSKITFKRLYHQFIKDGELCSGYVVWCKAHNSAARATELSKKTSNYHYIFAKYGLTKAFEMFAETTVEVGTSAKINYQNYPEDSWCICESTRMKPRGKTGIYRPTDVRLAIPRRNMSDVAIAMTNAFFYMADHFPEVVTANNVDDTGSWKAMLGHCIFRDAEHVRKIIPKMHDHMNSIDNSVDATVREWLASENIYVNDTYELFAHVSKYFNEYVTGSAKKLSSMYGKRLIVLRYVLDNIVGAINNTLFDLEKLAKKVKVADDGTRRSRVEKEDVEKVFKARIQPRLISKLNQKHAEVSSVSSACDCMIPKITSVMVLQSNMSGTQSSKSKATPTDESSGCDASIAEVAGFNNISKSAVDGRGKTNMFLKIRIDGTVEQDPRWTKLLTQANAIIHDA